MHRIGGQGAFVKEIQAAVLDGRADIAVHSAKDLPSSTDPRVWCSPASPNGRIRATPWSGRGLDDLGPGARGGHRLGETARPAGLAATRPHLRRAAGEHGHPARAGGGRPATAVLVTAARRAAGAGGGDREVLDTGHAPQVGQGALAVECREDDDEVPAARCPSTIVAHRAVTAERSFLAGSAVCTLPVGAPPPWAAPTPGRRGRSPWRACWPAGTGGSCCAVRGRGRPGGAGPGGWPRYLLDDGRRLLRLGPVAGPR